MLAVESESPSLTLLLLLRSSPTVVVHILSLLNTQDLHSVESTNKELNSLIVKNDKLLFSRCLRNDFYEGKVLVETVDTAISGATAVVFYGGVLPRTPYKKMHIAFRNRWKLTQQNKKSIKQPWRLPAKPSQHSSLPHITVTDKIVKKFYHYPDWGTDSDSDSNSCSSIHAEDDDKKQSTVITNDVNALVFIVRIGKEGDGIGLMEWESCKTERWPGVCGDKLVMNHKLKEDNDWSNNFYIPDLDNESYEMINTLRGIDYTVSSSEWSNQFTKVKERLGNLFCISLHAIDIQRFQVMTLFEDCPGHDIENFGQAAFEIYGHKCPVLFGVPPRRSPYFKPIEDYEFDSNYDDYDDYAPYIQSLVMACQLTIVQDDYPNVYMEDIKFDFDCDSTVIVAYEICNFFRELMKENCVYGGVPIAPYIPTMKGVVIQPEWLQTGIVDAIVSFVPFELQIEDVRLVCRQFKNSVMKQFESKLLDEVQVIGFERHESGWKKVQVRRGWSSDQFCDSKDSVIDDAFRSASCYCHPGVKCHCNGRDSSTSVQEKVVTFNVSKGRNLVLDLNQARAMLRENGFVHLHRKFPKNQGTLWDIKRNAKQHIEIEFSEEENTVFAVCDKINEIIEGNSNYDECEDIVSLIPPCFKTSYGISRDISNKQFLRSLFLVFTHDETTKCNETNESNTKKIRRGSASFARSVTLITSSHVRHFKMKCIIRFLTTTGKRIEILAEEKYSMER